MTEHMHFGDCELAENTKEAAYRKLPEKMKGTHIQVRECRDCGRKAAFVLDGHYGRDLDRTDCGNASTEAILNKYGL